MTEVAGKAAFLIPKKPTGEQEMINWLSKASTIITEVFSSAPEKRKEIVDAGLENVKRFEVENTLNQIESIYKDILKKENLR